MSRGRGAMSPARRKRIAQRFTEAARLQQAGNLAEAERGFLAVVEADEAHAPALHALALLRLRQGRRDEAIALMLRAAHGHDTDASLFNNLGNMLREAGRNDEAVHAYRRAVATDAGNLNAHFNLASLLLAAGDAPGAQEFYTRILAAAPRDVAVLIGLGRALLAQQQVESGLARLREAVGLAPHDPTCIAVLGQALLQADRVRDALDVSREAIARWPDQAAVLRVLARAQIVLEDFAAAERSLRRIGALLPGDADAFSGLVQALLGQWRLEDAIGECDAFIHAWPESAEGFASKGIALKMAGRVHEAVSAFDHALQLEPDNAGIWSNLGQTWIDAGDVARAHASLQHALELDPDLPEALFNLLSTRRNGPQHAAQVAHVETLCAAGRVSPPERVTLHFALGKALDDMGEYARAFEHYEQGNALKRASVHFEPEPFRRWAQGFHDAFTPVLFERCQGFGSDSERPVFIVGMPRSGTTLIEQILASHPQIHGADELTMMDELANSIPERLGVPQRYPHAVCGLDAASVSVLASEYLAHIASLDASSARVTDKMPDNFFHLGLIAVLFPNARVLHCERDPMDTCFSNFVQLFGAAHYYSYSLEHIACYYLEYRRIMAHWRTVLPIEVHDVSYEALIDDPRQQIQAMLDYLGLPWDEACLAFHATSRTVRTASHWQVRQPIYASSRQRWRRYARQLQGLAERIGYHDPVAG